MELYRNTNAALYRSAIGEVRSYAGWKQWAEQFYASLTHDEMGRDVSVVKSINVMMPDDWFKRVTKVLRLEPVSPE